LTAHEAVAYTRHTFDHMNDRAGAAQITRLLHEWQDGSQEAFDLLVPLVYDELHTLASRQLAREWRHDRLQTTVVVNEAYLKLFGQRQIDWQNRGHFFAIAAQLMRRILVDYARAHVAEKRGAGATLIPLSEAENEGQEHVITDILEVNIALERLARLDPDQVRIVELRYFAGLSVDETALVLRRSPRTVKREWRLAKAWLHRELRK